MRSILFLIGIFCAVKVFAIPNEELLKNMRSRIHPLSDARGSLIKSYSHHTQSYIYDQALAIISFTKAGDQKEAQALLLALRNLQLNDGSLYFSYFLDGTSPYPTEGDKRIAGAMAWVALAATHYQHKFTSNEFFSFNHKLLSYLQREIVPVKINGKELRTLRFAPNDIVTTAFSEENTAALEHNLDAFAAFSHFSRVNNFSAWNKDIADLKNFILALWDKDKSHFWSGVSLSDGLINKDELYLDNQTWSLLALDEETLKTISPGRALELNCNSLFVSHQGVKGFMDSKPARRPAEHQFVWSEGTIGQVMAMKKLQQMRKDEVSCKGLSSEEILTSVRHMKQADGGVAYATSSENPEFTTASSVAGTAWLYFASNNFNPFQIEELN